MQSLGILEVTVEFETVVEVENLITLRTEVLLYVIVRAEARILSEGLLIVTV